jgi:hypothetical protein
MNSMAFYTGALYTGAIFAAGYTRMYGSQCPKALRDEPEEEQR